jgi:hypothetical protein
MQITGMMQINLEATAPGAQFTDSLVAGDFDQFSGLYPVSQFKVVQEGQFLHFILLHAIIPQGFG